jgi:hypothetical protein
MSNRESRRSFLRKAGISSIVAVSGGSAIAGSSEGAWAADKPRRRLKVGPRPSPLSEIPSAVFAESLLTRDLDLSSDLDDFAVRPPAPTDPIRTEHANVVVYHALELTLSQSEGNSVIDTSRSLSIYADTLTISGTVRLPGKGVYIHARRIVCRNNAKIDVSGTQGKDDERQQAETVASNPGESGKKEPKPGGRGGNSGNVIIHAVSIEGPFSIIANGGRGGQGERGQNGAQGRTGPKGKDGNPSNDIRDSGKLFHGEKGGTGLPGGDGGPGGIGGDGGSPGLIRIHVVGPLPAAWRYEATEGDQGPQGILGEPGKGGLGGPGGQHFRLRFSGGSEELERKRHITPEGQAQEGDVGPSGARPEPIPPKRGTRTREPEVHTIDLNLFGARASITLALMMLHQAQLDYLNGRHSDAADYLFFLGALTQSDPGSSLPRRLEQGRPSAGDVAAPTEWKALRERVTSLILQLQHGLDFYGYPRHYVTLVDPEAFKARLGPLFDIAKDIEQAHSDYWKAGKNLAMKRTALAAAIKASRTAITELEAETQRLLKEETLAQLEARDLLAALLQQELVIQRLGNEFEEAVMRKAPPGCSLLDLITVAASIVTIATGAVQNVRNIAKAIDAHQKTAKKAADFISSIKVIKGEIDSIRKAYLEVKDKVVGHSNEVKLVIDTNEYDVVLEELSSKAFKDMPEAGVFRGSILTLTQIAQARNNRLTEYTTLVTKREGLQAQIVQQEAEIKRIETLMSRLDNPTLTECEAYMMGLLTEVKAQLARLMYRAHKALEYASLEPQDFQIQNRSVTEMEATLGNLLVRELDVMDRQGGSAQRMPPRKVTLTEVDHPELFRVFRGEDEAMTEPGLLSFSIPLGHEAFRGLSEVRIDSVSVSFEGATPTVDKELRIRVTHGGTGWFQTTSGEVRQYSHNRRLATVFFNPARGKPDPEFTTLGGEVGKFADLSPFASWTVELRKADHPGIDLRQVLKGVRAVNLEFTGVFRTPV